MATNGTQSHGVENASEPMSARDNSFSGVDIEKQSSQPPPTKEQSSAFKALGWLDRLLALWIFLAMVIGILLGNFVPSTGPALQKGKFVGVSIPIGTVSLYYKRRGFQWLIESVFAYSDRLACHDVPNPV